MNPNPTLKPCPFCGSPPARDRLPYGLPVARCANPNCDVHSGALTWVEWQTRPVEDALRARAEAAEAALAEHKAASTSIAVCDCGAGRLRLVDEDGLCVHCGCDVIVVADRHSADIVVQLRQERDAALATARAEGAVADALLSDGLEIVESLSGGYDVWCDAVRRRLTGGPVEGA